MKNVHYTNVTERVHHWVCRIVILTINCFDDPLIDHCDKDPDVVKAMIVNLETLTAHPDHASNLIHLTYDFDLPFQSTSCYIHY